MNDFFRLVDEALVDKLDMKPNSIMELLLSRERETTTVLNPYLAIPHIIIEGEGKFAILVARCKDGIIFSEKAPKVHAVFVLIGTKDERTFHLYCLAAIARIVQDPAFEEKWMKAKDKRALTDIILLGDRRRQNF
jgi:mannitol/fructose-specific phosphotransferase system IIA component (Ntr-type)